MTSPSLDRSALLTDLQKQVITLEEDLREQVDRLPEVKAKLENDHAKAVKAKRTAATFNTFLGDEITQAAVAWVLGTVFVRWCEDNRLIDPMLSGPDDRLAEAEDAHNAYFRQQPHATDADWIEQSFDSLRRSDAGAMLFDKQHNPAYRIPVSHDGAKVLVEFWRTRRPDGSLIHNFHHDSWDTRFLGDLYQDMSQAAKDKYALLQTPDFVEEFILDYTLIPALEEFGLEGFRLIDPTCGSGHFLLGAFHRLVDAWRDEAPGLSDTEIARKALDSVHGVDLNPFAVAIARFRLVLAAWGMAGVRTIKQAENQRWSVTVATGDSLLAGKRGSFDGMDEEIGLQLAAEDVQEFPSLLDEDSYHVVVGNPPYITVSDPALNGEYRRNYSACHRQFQLTVPFAQRFFELACRASADSRGAGFVGQITSNAFMKREFGTKLVQDFFPTVELTYVIDTSGAYIPDHGTPTVILVGRRRFPKDNQNVRAVLGIRGEPSAPAIPRDGLVWTSIRKHIEQAGSDSEWISVADFPRSRLAKHPWSLSGGGANELLAHLESAAKTRLKKECELVGFLALTREDDAYTLTRATSRRLGLENTVQKFAAGAEVRDWSHTSTSDVIFPYSKDGQQPLATDQSLKFLWQSRTPLLWRRALSGYHIDRNVSWFTYSDFHPSRWNSSVLICFAEVATHNHFSVQHGRKVFKQTAPIVKFHNSKPIDEIYSIATILNSSTACFWLKKTCFPKGGSGVGRGIQPENWMERYAFNSSNVEDFPLPSTNWTHNGAAIDSLTREISHLSPRFLDQQETPAQKNLNQTQVEYLTILGRAIAEQEELDWEVYQLYDLLSGTEAYEVLIADPLIVPPIKLGERAFEIQLARRIAAGDVETQWFDRHNSTPITELPAHWPEEYRRVVEARIALIEKRRDIALIEHPECKRRWATEPWEKQQERALREWLQDRLEARHLWFAEDANGVEQPTTRSVSELTDLVRGDADFTGVARLWATDVLGNQDPDLAEIVAALVDEEHVPFLPIYRYKFSGLRKRADWEHVWNLQRKEDVIAADLGKEVTDPAVREAVKKKLGDIPVPPKYGSGDFLRTSYWRHRGKLDVPKERFISYPAATRDGDGSLLLGWAGWDHKQQAHALAVLVSQRHGEDGWDGERLLPLLAGLDEVLPWVEQWHGEIDPAFGASPFTIYSGFLDSQLGDLHIPRNDLRAWQPKGRVDVAPLPRKAGRAGRTKPAPRARVDVAFTAEQFQVVIDFAGHGPMTTAQAAEVTGLPATTTRALLKHLVERGDLVQTGQRRGTKYELAGR